MLAQTYRRLLDLHEIGKLLIRFETPETTLPAILSILARALASSGAIILYEDSGGLRLGRSSEPVDAEPSEVEERRLRDAYGYLVGVTDQLPENDVAAAPRFTRPSSQHLAALAANDPLEGFVVLPLVVNVRAFGAVQIRGSASFDEIDLVFANMVVSELAMALDRRAATDVTGAAARGRDGELRRAERTLHFVADVSTALIDFRSHESVLAAAVRLAVPFLADTCFADELLEGGTLSRLKFGFTDEPHEALRTAILALAPSSGAHIADTRITRWSESLLIPDISDVAIQTLPGVRELGAAGAQSIMIVRLEARGQQFGVMTFVGAESRGKYDGQHLILAEELCRRVAMALDNERHARRSARVLRDRQEVLALVSHDLRDPLAALLMGAGGMLERPPESDRRQSRKTLELMNRSFIRMDHMIEDLVDTSSLESGRLAIQREWHPVSRMVAEAVESQAYATLRKSVTVHQELPVEPLLAFCDPYRLLQVLMNLLGNALRFTPHGGSILVTVRPHDLEIVFSVTNTGRGISAEDRARVFDRYWHTRAAGTLRHQGTGLGLYISKGIVEAHGGKLWVDSELHQSTTFSFSIPRGPPETLADPPGAI